MDRSMDRQSTVDSGEGRCHAPLPGMAWAYQGQTPARTVSTAWEGRGLRHEPAVSRWTRRRRQPGAHRVSFRDAPDDEEESGFATASIPLIIAGRRTRDVNEDRFFANEAVNVPIRIGAIVGRRPSVFTNWSAVQAADVILVGPSPDCQAL